MSKRHVRCVHCGSLHTKRNGSRKNAAGTIQRFSCQNCGTSFTKRLLPYVQVRPISQVDLTRRHIEDRTPIRELVRDTGHSSKTVVEAIHSVTAQVASCAWIANRFAPAWGGYLAIDGTTVRVWDWAARHFRYTREQRRWLHKMTLLVAQDVTTTDLPAHHLDSTEGTIELVTLLRKVQATGYVPKATLSDGNEDIPKAVALVFGKGIPHQICQLHYLKNLRKRVKDGDLLESQFREARRKLPKGERPKTLVVPDELFTYLKYPGLPRTNQQLEVTNRFFKLRLKTMGAFGSWESASNYTDALVAYRRFLKYTDRKRGRPNGKAPIELAGCNITGWDYLTKEKSNRKLQR